MAAFPTTISASFGLLQSPESTRLVGILISFLLLPILLLCYRKLRRKNGIIYTPLDGSKNEIRVLSFRPPSSRRTVSISLDKLD
jgi:hypothetical protein